MIELLTVIAIIAILAGIIFPVFGAVRENARRGACMSNMRQISQGLAQYKLDNRRYPDFLFGPAMTLDSGTGKYRPAAEGDRVVSMEEAAGSGVLPGLYPEYVKSVEVFRCPNNTAATNSKDASPAAVADVKRLVRTEGRNGPVVIFAPVRYYKYDSYDANRRIDKNTGKLIEPPQFVARYSRHWTPFFRIAAEGRRDPPAGYGADYSNQLIWAQPPADTYVTMCSYHVPGEKAVVLWLNGTTKVLDMRKFDKFKNESGEPAFDYDFWKFGPTD